MVQNSLLLQGGTVLIHNAQEHVEAIRADLLINGNTISKIEAGIQAVEGTKIVDCTDKLLCPGFVDTHHHLWQTLLKGRHANQQLLDYFYTGNLTSSLHTPADLFWAQLGGCLECIEVGTTTVVDHAHLNYSAENWKLFLHLETIAKTNSLIAEAALAATVSSGLRSFFCYCPTFLVDSWKPFKFHQNLLEDWVVKGLEVLASKAPFDHGRVQLGFAFDGWFLPKSQVVDLFTKVKKLGIKLITTHVAPSAIYGFQSVPELMDSYGLLDSSVLISHATCSTKTEAELIRRTGSHISCTPSTESQMALGISVAFNQELDIQSLCSIGADCHANNNASIVSEIRLLLQSSRAIYNQAFLDRKIFPSKLNSTVEEAFNLGTIAGAKAIGMENRIGTLAVGKLADILVFNKTNPSMIGAAQHDPVAAIVLHSQPADIEMVIVDGVVRKENGILKNVDLKMGRNIWGNDGVKKDTLQWEDIAGELLSRQEKVSKKIAKLDMGEARKGMIQAFYIDEKNIVDSL